jgi:hypothetical protein
VNNRETVDILCVADRLKDCFPNAKILAIVRNQIDALRSMYDFKPFDPMTPVNNKVIDFDTWLDINFKYADSSVLQTYRYYEILAYYKSIFGKENITVLNFDDLEKNPSSFYFKISNLLGVDQRKVELLFSSRRDNPGMSSALKTVTKLKKFIPFYNNKSPFFVKLKWRFHDFLSRKKFHKTSVSFENKDRVNSFYKKDNDLLLKEFGIKF